MKGLFIGVAALSGIAFAGCENSADTPVAAPQSATPAAQAPAPQPAATAAAPSPQGPQTTTEASLVSDPRWVVLFAGQDLSSFNQIGSANWTINGDVVEATSGEGGFLVTKGGYGDVQLRLEFWTSSEANSGIFMRCQDPEQISATSCYEVNIFDQRPDQAYRTGGIVNYAEPLAQMDAGNRWNTFDIIMEGSRLMVTMNDTLMVDTENDDFAAGAIGLQWSAGTVRFRNVMLRPL